MDLNNLTFAPKEQNSNPWSSDMETTTNPSGEVNMGWSISPEQSAAIKELSVQLAYDMAPVTGPTRAMMYADQAAQRAAQAFKQGKYWEGAGHTAEQYAEMLGALPVAGVALGAITDAKRFGKGMYNILNTPQLSMHKPTSITDPALEIRDKSLDEAIDLARTERHIIPDASKGTDGQFIGAPRGMNTRMELQQMRDDFDAMVAAGVAGSDWYKRAREGTKMLRPGSKSDRAEHSGQLAVLSAQADPSPNLGWAIEATNEFAAGNNRFMVRTPEQTAKIVEAHTGIKPPGEFYEEVLGPKTGVFEKGINPNKPYTTTGTNDIWHGRAFGYKMDDGSEFDRGFSPQEHRFLDHETVLAVDRANQKKLGGRSDWTAPELQAAAWIAAKGKGLFKKNPEKYNNNLQEAMKEAAKTYPDYYAKFTARQTHEAIPSPEAMDTGHLPSLKDASYDEKVEFTKEASWIDPDTNKDIMFDEMRMLQTDPGEARGLWKDDSNPVEVSNILVSLEDAARGKKVGETSEGLLSAGAAAKAYMDAQAGAAWSKAFELGTTGTKKTSSGSYSIDLDRPLTNTEMQNLKTIAKDKHGLDIIDTGEGVVLANFNATRGDMLAKSLGKTDYSDSDAVKWLDMLPTPLGKNINKVFTKNQAGALKEIKFKLKKDPSKKENAFFSDLRNGRAVHSWKDDQGVIQSVTDENKYKVTVKDRYVTIKRVKSPGDEMQKLLDEGLDKDINSIFPNYKGRLSRVEGDLKMYDWSKPGEGIATRQLLEYVQKNPAVLAKIDNNEKIRKQAGKIANRAENFAAKNNDTVRKDIQLSLNLIENGGFTALFDALKRGAVLPAIAGPMIMYGLRQESAQTEGLLSPES